MTAKEDKEALEQFALRLVYLQSRGRIRSYETEKDVKKHRDLLKRQLQLDELPTGCVDTK